MAKKKKANKAKIISAIKAEIRKAHFESGGSAKEWRGISAIHKNKKNKRQDRNTSIKKAVNESEQ
jgi:hypothetical protein